MIGFFFLSRANLIQSYFLMGRMMKEQVAHVATAKAQASQFFTAYVMRKNSACDDAPGQDCPAREGLVGHRNASEDLEVRSSRGRFFKLK
jgi:hypothetical protein